MPYSSVTEARKKVPALKGLSTAQVRVFIRAVESMLKRGEKEDVAIPKAISAAKRVDKSNEMSEKNIDKNTMNDMRDLLQRELENGWVMDFDQSYVYFETWDKEEEKYCCYKSAYTFSESGMEISEDKSRVIRLTEFKDVIKTESEEDEEMEKSFESKILNVLNKFFGGSQRDVQVIKQFDDEEMVAIEPLYIAPNDIFEFS